MNPAEEWKKWMNLRSIPYEDFPSELVSEYHFMEKIDGGLTAMIYVRGKPAVFLSKREIKRENLLVLKEYASILGKDPKIKSMIIMGESVGVKNGEIIPFNKTMSVITTAYKNPEFEKADVLYKIVEKHINVYTPSPQIRILFFLRQYIKNKQK